MRWWTMVLLCWSVSLSLVVLTHAVYAQPPGRPMTGAPRPNSLAYRSSVGYRVAEAAYKAGRSGEAARLLAMPAAAGDTRAMAMLGSCLRHSPATLPEAVRWARSGAAQRDPLCMYQLGLHELKGEVGGADRAHAVALLKRAIPLMKACASSGDWLAQGFLGTAYHEGYGVAKDSAAGIKWARKAAGQGFSMAQHNLGASYFAGDGVPKDPRTGLAWYRKAADQGEADAQFTVGICCLDGMGAASRPGEAVLWFRKAADQGHDDARYFLGRAYHDGSGVPRDLGKAAGLFRLSAMAGNTDAQMALGMCYSTGEGVDKDLARAATWFRRAAERGDADAQYVLGHCCFSGIGVPVDVDQALGWFRKSAKQGNAEAVAALKELGGRPSVGATGRSRPSPR